VEVPTEMMATCVQCVLYGGYTAMLNDYSWWHFQVSYCKKVANAMERESPVTFFYSISIGFIAIMENVQYPGHKNFENWHREGKRTDDSS